MSPTTVDSRVVELGFNNKEFETNTAQTLKTLDSLKKGLDLSESAKGLNNLQAAGSKFNLNHIGESVQSIASKFSAFGVIGFTVLQNLTNAAIEFGKKLITGFFQPMRMGFSEYEVQIGAIQTILANTQKDGTTLENVSAALQELNKYADQTIYNFTEMTRNIGTFTAAGVDLDTSVQAIKGIANLAAISGSTSQQAATAMYQLSQALSSGTVKLMDWNSVVNAGMGGQVFQDALKETARVSGIAIDDLIEKHGSFRETLQEGWLTSDVLLQTLAKFTGDLSEEQLKTLGYNEQQIAEILKLGQTAQDAATKVKTFSQLKSTLQEAIQSGWTQSWEIVIGDFNQAKMFFTEVSDTLGALISAGAAARNEFLTEWAKAGGREHLITTLREAFKGLLSVLGPIREAFKLVFPEEFTGTDLARITIQIREFAKTLTLSGENADRVKRIFAGVFSVFAILGDIVKNVLGIFFDLAGSIPLTVDGVLEFLARIGDFLTNLRESIDVSEGFRIAIEKIREVLVKATEIFYKVRDAVVSFAETVGVKLADLSAWFSNLFSSINTEAFSEFFDKVEGRFTPFTFLAKGAIFLIGGLFNLLKNIAPLLFSIGTAIWEFISSLGSAILEGLAGVDYVGLFDTINTGLIGALLLAIKGFMDSGAKAFSGISGILDGVGSSLEAWQQNLKAKTLMNIAAAIGVLALSLIAIALIPSDKLTLALAAITALVLNLVGALAAFSNLGAAGLATSIALVALAGSLAVLALSLKVLSTIDEKSLQRGIGAVYALTTAMLLFSALMSQNGSTLLTGSIGLIAFSVSLGVLVLVIKALGAMDPAEMTNGLIGVGVLLAELALFMRIIDGAGVDPGSGLGVLIIAGAILLLSVAIEKLGKMDVGVIQQGLLALGAVLAELSAFSLLVGEADLLATSVGLVIIAASMLIFAKAIEQLGSISPEALSQGLLAMGAALLIIAVAMAAFPPNMIVTAGALLIAAAALVVMGMALESMSSLTWEEIGRGLTVLAGALAILAIGLYAMTGTIVGSAALIIAAGAMALMAPALKQMGEMKISEIGLALLALAGVFTVLGLAGLILTPVVPTILLLGVAMLAIGAGAALIGVGLLAFSAGLSALAISGAAGAVAVVAFVTTILGLLPVIAQVLIDTIIVLAAGIVAAVPIIGDAILAIVLKILEIIIAAIPPLSLAITMLLLALIAIFYVVVPAFNEAVIHILLSLVQAIAEAVPDFVEAGFDILDGFLTGIRDNIADVVETVGEIIVEFLEALAATYPDIIQAGFDTLVTLINAFADAIEDPTNKANLNAATTNLIQSIIDGLVAGIGNLGGAFLEAMKQLAIDAINAMLNSLKAHSPSRLAMGVGETIPQGLIIGINSLRQSVMRNVKRMGESTADTLRSALGRVNDLINSDFDLSPRIRPVIDMSDVVSGGNEIDKFFRRRRSINILPAVRTASRVARDIDPGLIVPPTDPPIQTREREITFIQNNHSPKELSRLEIYRQTKNQLRTAKGVIG